MTAIIRKAGNVLSAAATIGRATLRPGPGSRSMKAVSAFIGLARKPLSDTDAVRRAMLDRPYPTAAPIPARLRRKANVTERMVAGHRVVTLAPKRGARHWHIVYLHGGAYVSELAKPHWDIVRALIEATGATVSVPVYPLAPEADHRKAFTFLVALYRETLVTTPAASIILAGDSAGGGLAMGLTLALRTAELPLPARLILFAPWLDLTFTDPEIRDAERRDVMLAIDSLKICGEWWAGDADPRSPELSPLYADPADFPPIDFYQGDQDLLVVDARTFAARAENAGSVRYHEYAGGFHVFMAATFMREAKAVYRDIATTLAS